MLSHDGVEIVVQLILCCTDVAFTTGLVPRPTSTTEDLMKSAIVSAFDSQTATHLQHIEDGKVDEGTARAVVHLSSLNNDRMRRQIDTPCECRGTA